MHEMFDNLHPFPGTCKKAALTLVSLAAEDPRASAWLPAFMGYSLVKPPLAAIPHGRLVSLQRRRGLPNPPELHMLTYS